MGQDIYFMPLGGGQRVGASCYFLKLGEANILLDAGIGRKNGLRVEPDFYHLLTSRFVSSLNQLNHIYISHAHSDHVGYLLNLMKEAKASCVYMTEITSYLTRYQLYDRIYFSGRERLEEERLAAQSMLDRVTEVSYMQKMVFGSYSVTFLPAGHIPGAMMLLFEYKNRKILYTGDFSLQGTALTGGCAIPEDGIDTVIMCGLHAKHPGYRRETDSLYRMIKKCFGLVMAGGSAMCYVPQLSKGIEFIKAMNECNRFHIPVYIDESVMKVVEKMERLHIPILTEDNHVLRGGMPQKPHIYVASRQIPRGAGYEKISVDFALHEDYGEMYEFLKRISPRQAYIVHCAEAGSPYDETIEQKLIRDGTCRTQIIFADDGECYKL